LKALVTGAAGFIGSHFCELLLDRGYQVVGIDNLRVGRQSNLELPLQSSRFSFVKLDVATEFEEIDKDFDVIFHLAALADIVPSITNPSEYFSSNVVGTLNVMEFARANRIQKVVYSASSSCYGIPDKFPTNEAMPIKPEYPYALTKFLGEQILLHWGKVYNIDVTSLRFFNVYGPRARTSGTYGAVFGVFLAQKLAGRPLTIVGDGEQTRDFTYVSDVADALLLASQLGLPSTIYNVGSGGTYSINDLANKIGGPIVHIPKRPGEPDCTFADVSRIKSELGWEPKVSFDQGVSLMLDNISEWKEAPVWEKESIADATSSWFKYLGKG
jgi:UDP-glucose 4-epimerase